MSWAYLMVLLIGSAVILWIGYRYLGHSDSTTFSIVAETRVFSLRPVCGARILWDLPPGEIDGFTGDGSLKRRSPLPVADSKSTSLGFGDDAVARVAVDDDGRIGIRVQPLEPDKKENSIVALRDGKPLGTDGKGFVYRTGWKSIGGGGARGNEQVPLTLRLLGRVVIGDVLPEGAGWRRATVPILGRGHLYGYDRAWVTEERLTLISEPIDPGAVVDTHPKMNSTDADGRPLIDIWAKQTNCASAEMGGSPAEGFARSRKDGDLEVVAYRRGTSVGIAPLGRPGMEIGVTWWSAFIASPVIQSGVALFGVLFFALQILTANRRMLPGRFWGFLAKERYQIATTKYLIQPCRSLWNRLKRWR